MNQRKLSLFTPLVPACAAVWIALTGLARADDTLGILDPNTGVLAPVSGTQQAAAAPAAPLNPHGTVTVKASLTFGAEIPTSSTVFATVTLRASDSTFVNSTYISPTASHSGRTGSVTATIPYNWTVAQAGETVTLFISLFTTGTNNASYAYTQTLSFALPAAGTTKTYSEAVGF